MARQPGERTRLRWGLRPGSCKVTARQGGWRRLGHLEIGPTDRFEGILAGPFVGQTRAEIAWTHHRSPFGQLATVARRAAIKQLPNTGGCLK